MRTPLAAAALALLGACLDTPSDPTWIEDIRPITMANCVRCHGAPPISQSPFNVRLDVYGTTYRPYSDFSVDGAADLAGAGTLVEQVFPTKEEKRVRMPPRFPLTDRQRDMLKDWSDAYNPDAERPGPPRTTAPDNHPPEIQISNTSFDLHGGHAELWLYDEDPDDYLTGMVYVVPVDEGVDDLVEHGLEDLLPEDRQPRDPRRPFGLLTLEAGPNTLDFTTDARSVDTHKPLFDRSTATHYDIYVEIDDGKDAVTIDLGFIELFQNRREP